MAGLREVLRHVLAAFRRRKLDDEAAALEQVPDQRGLSWLDGTALDLRHAIAALKHQPGFTLITVAALSSAVAVSTLIFTVVDGVLLRPLPYPAPDRLIRVFEWTPRNPKFPISILNYLEDRRTNRTLESIALYTRADAQLMHDDRAERLTAVQITDDFLPTLGVQPILGRNFSPSEMLRSARIVILGNQLWRTRFRSDPEILGKTIRLDRENWAVIGVLPAGFQHVGGSYRSPLQGETVALWTPLGLDLQPGALRNWHFTNVVARLRPGVSLQAAQEDLNRIMDDLARRFPDSYGKARARIEPLAAEVLGQSRQTVKLLMAAGALILCIACVNIAGLCVARVLARRRELAIRQALGCGSWRLVRAVLSENLVLGAAGGTLGLALAAALQPALRVILPSDFPRVHEIALSASGAVFAIAVAFAASQVAGLVPALRQTRVDPRDALSEDHRTGSAAREAQRLRGALLVCEVALACVLCFGTILLLRSSILLGARDQGFEARGALTFQLTLPDRAYQEKERVLALYDELLRRWREIPSVRAAGLATNVPWSGYDENTSFDIVGRQPRPGEAIQARFQSATPGFFEALRFRLLQGRLIEARDTATAARVVVINEALARRYFSGDALGRFLDLWGEKRQIVGIVADVRDRPADPEAEPAFWWPMAQQPFGRVQAVLRTDGDPLALLGPAGDVVHALDGELPIAEVATMDAVASVALAERRFTLWLFQAFATLAIALAALGIYGLLTYVVRQRRKELGIRMALGATRSGILSTVVRDGVLLTALGIGLGIALAPAAGHALSTLLYGITETDTVTLVAAPLIILAVSLVASLVPAWRASRTEPINALRDQ